MDSTVLVYLLRTIVGAVARPGRRTRSPMVPLSARARLLKRHSLLISPMSAFPSAHCPSHATG